MTAPGWYPAPDDPTAQRYWDGQAWAAPASPEAATTQGRSKRMPLLIGLLAAVVVVAALGLFFGLRGGSGSGSFTATGTFELDGTPVSFGDDSGNYFVTGKRCTGANGYDDITAGAQVTVSDESGKTLALGELGPGRLTAGTCTFPVHVAKVPTGHKFYKVTVTHRGDVQYTEKQMRAGGIALVLGNN